MSENENKKRTDGISVNEEGYYSDPMRRKRPTPKWIPWVSGGVVVVALLIGAYLVGAQTNKSSSTVSGRGFGSTTRSYGDFDDSSSTGGSSSQQGMPSDSSMRSGRGAMGTSGSVTAISSTSITIKDTMRGGLVTYTIDSSTKVTSGTTTKAVSDITTGATVRVQAATSDTTVAGTITLES